MTRIAGLTSGGGDSLFQLHRTTPGGAALAVVVTDTDGADAIEAAAARGIPAEVIAPEELVDVVTDYDVDLVCLDGYDPGIEEAASSLPPAVGLHRSLLPVFPGDDPIGAALEAGVRVTGVTIHAIGEGEPIVTQEPVAVFEGDDRAALAERLFRAGAMKAYPRAVQWFAEGRVSIDDGAVTIEGDDDRAFPARRLVADTHVRTLRYGENPHQQAALYADPTVEEANVVAAPQRNEGAKALSYNNYNDADGALNLVKEFDRPAAAVIKHTNPAGCAVAESVAAAYDRALRTDPMSAFGGVVSMNRPCDADTAAQIVESFKEVVVAPSYTDGALEVLATKENLRVLEVGELAAPSERFVEKPVVGGRLVQERDLQRLTADDLEPVTDREPTTEQIETMLFAWQTIKHVKSNAIVFAAGTETVGIGMGQVSRVDAVRLAALKADEHAEGKDAEGAVMASDAFFPFPDGIEAAAEAGIDAVIQPGGSVNDEAVIEAADELGLAMVLTGQRCFRHD